VCGQEGRATGRASKKTVRKGQKKKKGEEVGQGSRTKVRKRKKRRGQTRIRREMDE